MNGWVAPLAQGGRLGWVPATVEQSISQNIRAAVLTRIGERKLQPHFGSRVHEFFFRILDSALIAELESHLSTVISQCEPRISLNGVHLKAGKAEANEIQLFVRYEILQNNRPGEIRISVKP
jgi:uncharacterized protein